MDSEAAKRTAQMLKLNFCAQFKFVARKTTDTTR